MFRFFFFVPLRSRSILALGTVTSVPVVETAERIRNFRAVIRTGGAEFTVDTIKITRTQRGLEIVWKYNAIRISLRCVVAETFGSEDLLPVYSSTSTW